MKLKCISSRWPRHRSKNAAKLDFSSRNSHTPVQSWQQFQSQKLLLCRCFFCTELGVPRCLCLRVDTFKEFRGKMLSMLSIYKPCVEVRLILAGFTSWQVFLERAESHYNEWRCVWSVCSASCSDEDECCVPRRFTPYSDRRNMKRTY